MTLLTLPVHWNVLRSFDSYAHCPQQVHLYNGDRSTDISYAMLHGDGRRARVIYIGCYNQYPRMLLNDRVIEMLSSQA